MAMRGIFHGVLYCCLTATLPAIAQAPQPQNARPGNATRPAPGNTRPGRPVGGGNNNGRPPGNGGPPPRPQPGRPQPGRPQRPISGTRPPSRPGRPPQWGRPPVNRPNYQFRPNDRDYLRRYYRHHFGYINRARRPRFVIGGFFPYADIGYLTPLPPSVYGYLPPPPPGYQMGYWDGYVVVYDPVSYFIANVIDLL